MYFNLLFQEGISFELGEFEEPENVRVVENSALQEELNALQIKYQESVENLQDMVQSNKHLQNTNDSLTKEVSEKLCEISALEERVKKTNTKYEETNDSLKLLTRNTEKEISDLKHDRDVAENKIKELLKKHQRDVSELNGKILAKDKWFQEQLEESNLKKMELETTISKLENEVAEQKKVCIWYREGEITSHLDFISPSPKTKVG